MNFLRRSDLDKRIRHGDDFAGDAWEEPESHEIFYCAVGFIPTIYRGTQEELAVLTNRLKLIAERLPGMQQTINNLQGANRDVYHESYLGEVLSVLDADLNFCQEVIDGKHDDTEPAK